MTFTNIWILHFLWVIPLIAFVLMVQHRRRQRALVRLRIRYREQSDR